jgi:hypothetical protein
VDWFIFGAALDYQATLWRAWQLAAARGLGPTRRPFSIRAVVALGPRGELRPAAEFAPPPVAEFARNQEIDPARSPRTPASPATKSEHAWTLADAQWPLDPRAACALVFAAPLRLRRQGRLIDEPSLADIVVAASRRIAAFLPAPRRDEWQARTPAWLELAHTTTQGRWVGTRLDLHRYSARQQSELDLRGVTGSLELPVGPGELAPLLAAARWLHLGKGTVMGLGQMAIADCGSRIAD